MTTDVQCPGCGESFAGERGLRAHQTRRFQTMSCRPRPAEEEDAMTDHPTPQADLAARWRPSDEQVAAAVAQLEESGHPDWLAAVPLAMPGKVHGIWETGQPVEHPPGVWLGANSFDEEPSYSTARNLAAEAGSKALGDRAGTAGWATVRADGTWAVFEDF